QSSFSLNSLCGSIGCCSSKASSSKSRISSNSNLNPCFSPSSAFVALEEDFLSDASSLSSFDAFFFSVVFCSSLSEDSSSEDSSSLFSSEDSFLSSFESSLSSDSTFWSVSSFVSSSTFSSASLDSSSSNSSSSASTSPSSVNVPSNLSASTSSTSSVNSIEMFPSVSASKIAISLFSNSNLPDWSLINATFSEIDKWISALSPASKLSLSIDQSTCTESFPSYSSRSTSSPSSSMYVTSVSNSFLDPSAATVLLKAILVNID